MAKRKYTPVDRQAEAARMLDEGGIVRVRFTVEMARTLGTAWAYGVPSRSTPGQVQVAHPSLGCSCRDWKSRQPAGGCAHMLVAAEMERRDRAAKVARQGARREAVGGAQRQPEQQQAEADGPVILTDAEDARLDLAFAARSPLAGLVVQTIRPTRYDALFPAED